MQLVNTYLMSRITMEVHPMRLRGTYYYQNGYGRVCSAIQRCFRLESNAETNYAMAAPGHPVSCHTRT